MMISRLAKHPRDNASLGRAVCLTFLFGLAAVIPGSCANPSRLSAAQDRRQGITKGPVLLRVYKNRAAVMWETKTPGPGKLWFGRAGSGQRSVSSTPQQVSYKLGAKLRQAYIHKTWIEDLEPGRNYQYRIEGPGVAAGPFAFKTAPENTDRARFIVYGDSRTNPDTHRRLVEAMMKIENLDFIVHVGDLLSSGNKYEQWGPQHFDVVKGLCESIPMYIAKGNHEGDNGNYEKLLVPPGEKNNFAFDFGPVHYFCGDNSSKKVEPNSLLGRIARDARAATATWKFVTYHVPSINFGHHWSAWGYPEALPTISRAGVDFVIAGHSHLYERFCPIQPPEGSDASFVTYITTGGGGAPLHEVEKTPYHAHAEKTNHFCLFDIDAGRLKMDVIDIEGKVIDRLRLTKTKGRLDPDYLATAIKMAEVLRYQKAKADEEH